MARTIGFQFHLGRIRHGWVEVTIGEIKFSASDVPGDSLKQLAESILSILDKKDATTEWNLEPEEYRMNFKNENKDTIAISLINCGSHGKSANPTYLFNERFNRDVVLRKLWKSLQDIRAAYFDKTGVSEHWSHPFPTSWVDEIGEKI